MIPTPAGLTAPDLSELPTGRILARATVSIIAIALLLLICAVLPAERGIDPTGIGSILGLTEMGEMKMEFASEVAAREKAQADSARRR